MTALWERTVSAEPSLERWVSGTASQLDVGRLPRPAWPIVAGAVARACAAFRRSVLVLVPAPERFADELRPWLAGHPTVHVFSEVGVSFLDRPPAFDESVNKRLEALAALARSGEEPTVVVASRRAMTRQTISPQDLAALTAQGPLNLAASPCAARLSEILALMDSTLMTAGRCFISASWRARFAKPDASNSVPDTRNQIQLM